MIRDFYYRRIALPCDGELSSAREFHRVVDEIGKSAFQLVRVSVDNDLASAIELDIGAQVDRVIHNGVKQGCKIEGYKLLPCSATKIGKARGNHGMHLLEIAQDLRFRFSVLNIFSPQAHSSNGCPQVMTNSGEHARALVYHFLDASLHAVECARRGSHFFRARLFNLCGSRIQAERLHRLGEIDQGTGDGESPQSEKISRLRPTNRSSLAPFSQNPDEAS